MFRLLGLHPGPDIDRQACAAIAGVPFKQAGFLLRELLNAHLIEEHTPDRFRFHDLLRVYAAEQAEREDPEPERTGAAQRFLDHYLDTSFAADRCIDPSRQPITDIGPNSGARAVSVSDYGAAYRWCDAEHHVLIAAIDYAHRRGWYRHAWQLSWAIAVFLQRAGLYRLYAATQKHRGEGCPSSGRPERRCHRHPPPGQRPCAAGKPRRGAHARAGGARNVPGDRRPLRASSQPPRTCHESQLGRQLSRRPRALLASHRTVSRDRPSRRTGRHAELAGASSQSARRLRPSRPMQPIRSRPVQRGR